jgi:hypothetical protein
MVEVSDQASEPVSENSNSNAVSEPESDEAYKDTSETEGNPLTISNNPIISKDLPENVFIRTSVIARILMTYREDSTFKLPCSSQTFSSSTIVSIWSWMWSITESSEAMEELAVIVEE